MALPQAKTTTSQLTPERWGRIESLFHAALECDASKRAALLEEACAADAELRVEVEALLAVEAEACGFLASVTSAALESLADPASSPSTEPSHFGHDGRFLVRRKIGSGGFGIVYEAFDREQNTVVALKTLRAFDEATVQRFKKEFRSLAGIYHPNLVPLYELIADDDEWFFTMELVDGKTFGEHVAGSIERLRAALGQLAGGVHALHQERKLHCDLKPSNVLVTAEGRVVVLDFGLVTEIEPRNVGTGNVAGTPSYMAPEQMVGTGTVEASDWYSVGVMLYEALTGNAPFSGSYAAILAQKRSTEPPSPEVVAPDVPKDLASLCQDLLRGAPTARPSGEEILRRLGVVVPQRQEVGFYGRGRELEALRSAYEAIKQNTTKVVLVQGESGIGKTSLVRHFLDELSNTEGPLILEGRCYEQESVPYKALDSLVDNLCSSFDAEQQAQIKGLTPDHTPELLKLFPALRRIMPSSRSQRADAAEPHLMRVRAFGAMKQLMGRLAEMHPLVLFIDDLQWGDADSGALLSELLSPPNAPSLLFIGCYRNQGLRSGPLVDCLLSVPQVASIEIGQLAAEEARELAAGLMPESSQQNEGIADWLALRSGGNPFLLQRLVTHSQMAATSKHSSMETDADGEADWDEMVRRMVSHLSPGSRRLLEVVAVAGRPVEFQVAREASELEEDLNRSLAPLRSERLIRIQYGEAQRRIEPYHDRIRQSIVSGLSEQGLRSHHAGLALAWEASNSADPETLAVHFQAAGVTAKAGHYATVAADIASEALAFDSAARLYRLALDLLQAGARDSLLNKKLGDALSNAGRGSEGAGYYLQAAEQTSGFEALELQRRAATQYLLTGHVERGKAVLRSVLRSVRMSLPSTPRRTLASLVARRTLVRLRSLRFRERDEQSVPIGDLIRIDACWSVAQGLGFVDAMQAANLHAAHLMFALRSGERYRVARAFSVEAAYSAFAGGRTRRRTQKLAGRAAELSATCAHPHAIGLSKLTSGIAAFLEGRWKDAAALMRDAEGFLEEHCIGVAWELATARLMGGAALYFMGQFRRLTDRLPALLREADARGDLYEATALRARLEHIIFLMQDAPELALQQVREGIARWPGAGFQTPHWWSVVSESEILLYSGRPQDAFDLWDRLWPRIRQSNLLRLQYLRIETLHQRASSALAAAVAPGISQTDRERLLAIAAQDAQRIDGERMPWSRGLGSLIQAGVAIQKGQTRKTAERLIAAETDFESADMLLFAAVARRRRGELLGGEEGQEAVRSANDWMIAQNIRRPDRMTAMLAPGIWQQRNNSRA